MGGVSQGDSLKICFDGDWYFWLLGKGRGWKATKVLPKKEVFCDWSDHRIQTKMRTTMTY